MNLVEKAIRYANDQVHEGSGYILEVLHAEGLLEFKVEMFQGQHVLIDVDTNRAVFIDWDAVRMVTVVW